MKWFVNWSTTRSNWHTASKSTTLLWRVHTSAVSTPTPSIQGQVKPSSLWRENAQRAPWRFYEFPHLVATKKWSHKTDHHWRTHPPVTLRCAYNVDSTTSTLLDPIRTTVVNKTIKKCVACRKICGTAYYTPDPPPQPKATLRKTQPFEITGIDITGALYVKESGTECKAFICLFTCAATRAIHLEVVTDMSLPTFILAFRRFVGAEIPAQTYDVGQRTIYWTTAEELKKLVESLELKEIVHRQNVYRKFIGKGAPWFGGFRERLIGLTKTSLKKVLGRASVKLVTLQTIMVEIETILNDRRMFPRTSSMNNYLHHPTYYITEE